ncbi:hypothetical protein EMCRGX_G012581 [Ephydatia muelleri]
MQPNTCLVLSFKFFVYQDSSCLPSHEELASFLEKSTGGQSSSVLWFDHRKGCITSSVVGSVARFQFKAYPLARVKSVLQYSQLSSTGPALEWGCLNEENARQQYYALASTQHINFQLQLSGLHIDTQHPYLGATPDGIVSCDCCGTGFLEIECPFTYKHSVLSDIDDEKKFICKEMDDDDSDGDEGICHETVMEIWLHVMVQIAYINGFIFSVLGSVKNLLVNGIVVIASILIDLTPFAIIV